MRRVTAGWCGEYKVRSPGRPYLPITDRPGAALSIPNRCGSPVIPSMVWRPPMPMIRSPRRCRKHPARPGRPFPCEESTNGCVKPCGYSNSHRRTYGEQEAVASARRSPHSCERRTCRTNSIIPQCIAKAKKCLTNPAWNSGFLGERDDTRLSASKWEDCAHGTAQNPPHGFSDRTHRGGRPRTIWT